MTKTYELPNEKRITADVDEKHHTATVSVYALDDLVEAVNNKEINVVLDKIRAEIEQKQYDFMADKDYDEGIRFGLMLAYQIIDKYKAESEE